jgi:hypothetical protein
VSSLRLALLAIALAASPVLAAEPGPSAGDRARQAMREAMMRQAAVPVRAPVIPPMKAGDGGPMHDRTPPARDRGGAARDKAMGSGMHDASAVRAEMANRAARGGAAGTMMQTTGDMMNAPMMQRSQGMDPGGGMMPGGGMGPGGMGPGGMGPGGMPHATAPGSTQPPAGGR